MLLPAASIAFSLDHMRVTRYHGVRQTRTARAVSLQETAGSSSKEDEGDGVLVADSFRTRYGSVLPEWLLQKCEDCGWTHPTRIQERVLDAVLLDDDKATDAIVQAETGASVALRFTQVRSVIITTML